MIFLPRCLALVCLAAVSLANSIEDGIPYLPSDIRELIYNAAIEQQVDVTLPNIRLVDRHAAGLLSNTPLWKHKIQRACYYNRPRHAQNLMEQNRITLEHVTLDSNCFRVLRETLWDRKRLEKVSNSVRTVPTIDELVLVGNSIGESELIAFIKVMALTGGTLKRLSLKTLYYDPSVMEERWQRKFRRVLLSLSTELMASLEINYEMLAWTFFDDVWVAVKRLNGLQKLVVNGITEMDDGFIVGVLGKHRLTSLSLHWSQDISDAVITDLASGILLSSQTLQYLRIQGPGAEAVLRLLTNQLEELSSLRHISFIDPNADTVDETSAGYSGRLIDALDSLRELEVVGLPRFYLSHRKHWADLKRHNLTLLFGSNSNSGAEYFAGIYAIPCDKAVIYPRHMAYYPYNQWLNKPNAVSLLSMNARHLYSLNWNIIPKILNATQTNRLMRVEKLSIDKANVANGLEIAIGVVRLPNLRVLTIAVTGRAEATAAMSNWNNELLLRLFFNAPKLQSLVLILGSSSFYNLNSLPALLYAMHIRNVSVVNFSLHTTTTAATGIDGGVEMFWKSVESLLDKMHFIRHLSVTIGTLYKLDWHSTLK